MSSFPVAPPYQLAPSRYGTMLVNPNDFYMGAAYLKYGECSQIEADFLLQLLQVPGQVIEVGANMGVHTIPMALELARQGRTMLAFEPQPVIFQQLCANLALHGLMNVTAIPYAVGAEAGKVSFVVPNYREFGNFGSTEMVATDPAAPSALARLGITREVACYPLDQYIHDGEVSLIKVDVEGFELQVLKGAANLIAKTRPTLYVENDRPAQSPALIGWLLEHRYRLWWHTPPLFNPANRLGVAENIYQGIASFNMVCIPAERNWTVQGDEILDPSQHPLLPVARSEPELG